MESIQSVTQITDDKSGFSLTASHLLEYLFCPRFTYFEYVLDIPQHEDKRFKVEVGREIHKKIRRMNPDYLRKKLGVQEKEMDAYLAGRQGIRGIVDEIVAIIQKCRYPEPTKYKRRCSDCCYRNLCERTI